MEVRGRRECKECGTEWSYFETGSPACPECGSLYSVGTGERKLHTDRPTELDVGPAIAALDEEEYKQAGAAAEETARKYVHRRGFIAGGELRRLGPPYVAAQEIRQVAQYLRTGVRAGPAETALDLRYVHELFESAAAGERPAAEAVPDSMRGPRGRGAADAVADYRDAVKTFLAERETDPVVDRAVNRLDSHVRRVRALDGDVEAQTVEDLIGAARVIGQYVRGDAQISAVEAALEDLGDDTH